MEGASSSRSTTTPRRLDPELVYFLYFNFENDQLVTYIDGFLADSEDRACLAIRRSAMMHLPRSIESLLVLRREEPTNAGRKLFGNSLEIQALLRLRTTDLTCNSSSPVMPTTDTSERETFQQGGKITWSSIPSKKPKYRLPVSNVAENENNNCPTTGTGKQEAAVRVSAAGEVLEEHPSIGLDAAENDVLDAEQKCHDTQRALHQMEGKIKPSRAEISRSRS